MSVFSLFSHVAQTTNLAAQVNFAQVGIVQIGLAEIKNTQSTHLSSWLQTSSCTSKIAMHYLWIIVYPRQVYHFLRYSFSSAALS